MKSTLLAWDLWRDELRSRIVPVVGDLGLPGLGIETTACHVLSENIDTIYHCGTSMNHLETYMMAKAVNVGSCSELLDFSTHGRNGLLNCISTLGSAVREVR